ncbi:hypothetical protein H0H81_004896 [Sphagnurus paluster]|uniref:F-box domain-containing protein n=1 Tax=Sphagnurus paluster TaxID=117069 RepID=A0A9P7FU85_9AGAR|nr:hypothetical protein H0H81_004896 [Sphagnurus paluster]
MQTALDITPDYLRVGFVEIPETKLRSLLSDAQQSMSTLEAKMAPLVFQRTNVFNRIQELKRTIAPLIFATFPSEVLVKVFEFCMDGPVHLNCKNPRPTTLNSLSAVCGRWRLLVLKSPVLWNKLRISFWDYTDAHSIIQAAHLCLARSESLPLSIDMRGFSQPHKYISQLTPVQEIIIPLISRLCNLTLFLPFTWLKEFLSLPPGSLPMLEAATIKILPETDSKLHTIPSLKDIMNVFAGASRLHRLTFRGSSPDVESYHSSGLSPPQGRATFFDQCINIQLPWGQLTHFSLLDIPVNHRIFIDILNHTPNLVSLALTSFWSFERFDETQLSPHAFNIKSLTLVLPKDIQFSVGLAIVNMFPHLISLNMTMFADIACSPPVVHLVHLRSLTLKLPGCSTNDVRVAPFLLPSLQMLCVPACGLLHGDSTELTWPTEAYVALMERSSCRLLELSFIQRIKGSEAEQILESMPTLIALKMNFQGCQGSSIIERLKAMELVPLLGRFAAMVQHTQLEAFVEMLLARPKLLEAHLHYEERPGYLMARKIRRRLVRLGAGNRIQIHFEERDHPSNSWWSEKDE